MATQLRSRRDHAVVVGASMGGLLAARVLADAYDRVTVLERDTFPALIESRKGVPQGRHIHALLTGGREVLDDLFPGFSQELTDAGAPTARVMAEITFAPGGQNLLNIDIGQELLLASRPFLESHTRHRVRMLENVVIRERAAVAGITATQERDRVTGVEVAEGDGGSAALDADLVVDAGGRAGAALRWLDDLGYRRPPEESIPVDVGYASRNLKLPLDSIDGRRFVLIGNSDTSPHGFALVAQEHRTWKLTLIGYGDARPASDAASFTDLAHELAPAGVSEALADAEWLDAPVTHRFPSNLWRRYDRIKAMPKGLLVLGDAICSFNPIYGQGMTVAAQEAAVLRRCLDRTDGDSDLAKRFFKGAARVVGNAWQLSALGDLAFPYVEGRGSPAVRATNAYAARVLAAAGRDPAVLRAFIDVAGLLAPPSSLMRPSILRRVLGRGGRGR